MNNFKLYTLIPLLIFSINLNSQKKDSTDEKKPKKDLSEIVGKLIAERCLEKGCKEVYFDRGKYKYHGRVKQLAESAKTGGLKF